MSGETRSGSRLYPLGRRERRGPSGEVRVEMRVIRRNVRASFSRKAGVRDLAMEADVVGTVIGPQCASRGTGRTRGGERSRRWKGHRHDVVVQQPEEAKTRTRPKEGFGK